LSIYFFADSYPCSFIFIIPHRIIDTFLYKVRYKKDGIYYLPRGWLQLAQVWLQLAQVSMEIIPKSPPNFVKSLLKMNPETSKTSKKQIV
jgi:hypothetical protein